MTDNEYPGKSSAMRCKRVFAVLLLTSAGLLLATPQDDDPVAVYEQYHAAILRIESLKDLDHVMSAPAIERHKAMSEDAQRLALFTKRNIHQAVVRISLFANAESAVVVMMVAVAPPPSKEIVPVNVRMVRDMGKWKVDREDQNEIFEQPTSKSMLSPGSPVQDDLRRCIVIYEIKQ